MERREGVSYESGIALRQSAEEKTAITSATLGDLKSSSPKKSLIAMQSPSTRQTDWTMNHQPCPKASTTEQNMITSFWHLIQKLLDWLVTLNYYRSHAHHMMALVASQPFYYQRNKLLLIHRRKCMESVCSTEMARKF